MPSSLLTGLFKALPDQLASFLTRPPRAARSRARVTCGSAITVFSAVGLVWAGLACVGVVCVGLTGCELATPFAGGGYRSGTGVTLAGAGDQVVVGVTHAVLDGDRREPFDAATRKVIESLPGQDGYIGHSVRARVLGNEVWTMTVWRDAAALDAFVRSPAHRSAMASGLSAVNRAQFMRLVWPTATAPPPWDEVLRRLRDVEFVEYRSAEPDRADRP